MNRSLKIVATLLIPVSFSANAQADSLPVGMEDSSGFTVIGSAPANPLDRRSAQIEAQKQMDRTAGQRCSQREDGSFAIQISKTRFSQQPPYEPIEELAIAKYDCQLRFKN